MQLPHRLVALVLCLCLAGVAAGEVQIAPKDRVENRPPGRCGWCVVETLARHHHIQALFGLTENNPSRAQPEDLEDALEEARVPYRIQFPGAFGTRILKHAIRKNLGAAIGFRELFPGAGGHIVTLVEYQPQYVKVLDPSDPDYRIRTMSMDQFLNWWDGFALVLEKPRTNNKVANK